MALMRWDPFTALARMDTEFDDLVQRTFGTATYQYVPAVEMATEGNDVVITLELPGVDVSDLDIEVVDGRLTVSGERRDRWEDSRGKVLVRELRYGAFRRVFQLPDGVGPDQVEAEFDQGLLRLRVKSVTKPATPPRKIEIRSSQQSKTIEARGTEQPAKGTGQAARGTGQANDQQVST